MNCDSFSCLIFERKKCQYPQAQKLPQMVKYVNTLKLYTTDMGEVSF